MGGSSLNVRTRSPPSPQDDAARRQVTVMHHSTFCRDGHCRRICQSERKPNQRSGCTVHLIRRQQNARAGGPVPRPNVKENLSAYFGILHIFDGGLFDARDHPRPGQPTPGVSCGGRLGSKVAAFNCRTTYRSLELAIDHESVRPVTTARHCHHPPGIKNCPSETYIEIGADRLR
jgi:hypothetical protein